MKDAHILKHSPILKEKGKGSNVLCMGRLTYCRPFSLILNDFGGLSRGACSVAFFFFLIIVLAVGLRLDRLQSAVRTLRMNRVFQARGDGDRDQKLLVD